jgi:regulatory protein YycH of two-component signal transduction system YycFG
MMEKFKTVSLVVLVLLSLVQSYFLAYSFPNLGATISTGQDYVPAEPMGMEETVENVIFPQEIALHFGSGQHTVLSPGTNVYERIFNDRIRMREFKGFQQYSIAIENWTEIRANDPGVELRFESGVPVSLLKKVMKLDGDFLFLSDSIERIWMFKERDSEEVRVYFFSNDGLTVYRSTRADITLGDLKEYLGFGSYWTPYRVWQNRLYLPDTAIEAVQYDYGFNVYTPERMQRNLFSDPGTTKMITHRSGSQIYTDGKRGLQIDQKNGKWMSYTNPIALLDGKNDLGENVVSAIQFINQHGGWDGVHRFVAPERGTETSGSEIVFQQYHFSYPVIGSSSFLFGHMRLLLQQGGVAEYERSLATLGESKNKSSLRWLPGGDELQNKLAQYVRRSEVVSLYPALQASLTDNQEIRLEPVWAVRLHDGSDEILMHAFPSGTKVSANLPKVKGGFAEGSVGAGGSGAGGTGPGKDPGALSPRLDSGTLGQ